MTTILVKTGHTTCNFVKLLSMEYALMQIQNAQINELRLYAYGFDIQT